MEKVEIFISYSHEDTDLFRAFKKGIEAHSKNSTQIIWNVWADVEILSGKFWHEEIQDAVKKSEAAILLVSSHFFSSDYIKNEEFLNFVKNNRQGFTFFPVLLSDCDYSQWDELVKIQFFNPQGQDYDIDKFNNQIVPYDYINKDSSKNTYYKNCVSAFEKAIKSKYIKKNSEISEIQENANPSQKSIQEQFQEFQNQIIKHIEQQDNKINELHKALDFLIEEAYHGLKPIYNYLLINFDKKNRQYLFEFEKQFKIIATKGLSTKYEAQFYANKFLTNRDYAKEYYETNKISWNKLGVGANISILETNGKEWSDEKEVKVNPIINSGNYIPFTINFEPKDKTVLNLQKDNILKIKYWYKVPIKLWGNYINRHISYFEELLIVEFEYETNNNENLIDKIEILFPPNGIPDIISNEKYKKTEYNINNRKKINIEFKGNKFEKYRITWDSAQYFGDNEFNTDGGEDQLGVTNK
jgi:hypothetical protein